MVQPKRPRIGLPSLQAYVMKSTLRDIPLYILFVLYLPLIWVVFGVCLLRNYLAKRKAQKEGERVAQQEAALISLNRFMDKIGKAPEEDYNRDQPAVWKKETGSPVQYLPEEEGWR